MMNTGAREAKAQLLRYAEEIPRKVASAMYQEQSIDMAEMQARTPVDEGTLRASGTVDLPIMQRKKLIVYFHFGGAAASYAIYVHEDLTAFHETGQAKFAESVIYESAPHMAQRIVDRLGSLM